MTGTGSNGHIKSQSSFTDLTQTSSGNIRHSKSGLATSSLPTEEDDSYHEATLQRLQQHLIPKSRSMTSASFDLESAMRQKAKKMKGEEAVFRGQILHQQLSPPTPFADVFTEDLRLRHFDGTTTTRPVRQCRTLPRKMHAKGTSNRQQDLTILPPPPQYKGVHFAPSVQVRTLYLYLSQNITPHLFSIHYTQDDPDSDPVIPPTTEGLPTRPASAHPKTTTTTTTIIIPASETVPIKIRSKTSGEVISLKPPSTPSGRRGGTLKTSSSMTFNPDKKSSRPPPPTPPPRRDSEIRP